MRSLRFIRQRKWTECGVACLAMVAGLTLRAAREKFAFPKPGYYGADVDDMRRAFEASGKRLGRKVRSRTWARLRERNTPITALVAVSMARRGTRNAGYWHWVLFNGNHDYYEILDPKRGRRQSEGKLRISWYHLIKS
jgi:hypothetical protein